MASSASGHVFECTFDPNGVFIERGVINGKKWISPVHPTGGGLCEDYREVED